MTRRIRFFALIAVIGIITSSSVPTAQSGTSATPVSAADDPDFAARRNGLRFRRFGHVLKSIKGWRDGRTG